MSGADFGTYTFVTNRGITYQPADGNQTPPQLAMELDAYVPQGTGPLPGGKFPWVIGIHGGGWTSGNRAEDELQYEALAKGGIAVFGVDYTLWPDPGESPSWPRCFEDLVNAVAYVRDTLIAGGGDYAGLSSEKPGAFGTSAGGHLAYMLWAKQEVWAADGWSGPYDLESLFEEGHEIPVGDLTNGLCGPHSGPTLANYTAASPKANIPASGAGPLQVWNGSTEPDILLADAQAFHDAVVAAGWSCDLQIHQGPQHAAAYSGAALAPTIAFFQANLS
jgi:acetyl esterase/lipase